MSRPLVSIVMPTFNRRGSLAAAIDSVLTQTLDDFELLIVDDASTDGTAELLAARAGADRRIRVLRLANNGGCNAARNLALAQARGRYLAFLDDDDLFLPQRLELTVARLEAEPGLGVAFCRFAFIDAQGQPLPWAPAFLPIGESTAPGEDAFRLLYCDWGWIPTCTLTVRAEQLAGLAFLEVRRRDNDALFNAQLAASGASFAQLSQTLALVRRDPTYASMSRDRRGLLADRRASLLFLRSWLADKQITRFDHLHGRAWSNHLVTEAEQLGGLRGIGRLVRAAAHWPTNPRTVRYVWKRIAARLPALKVVLALAIVVLAAGCEPVRPPPVPVPVPVPVPRGATIAERVEQYGPAARSRLLPYFRAAGVPYPPTRFLLLGLKQERELQLYAAGAAQPLAFIRSFAVLGASGQLGPKLREGDRQVPEGVYRIEYLNPNSVAHLSVAVSYPNAFDRAHGEEDGREAAILGGDIMIHGGSGSVGCLAIGDRAAEDLFVLADDAGWQQAVIVISPVDFRRAGLPPDARPTEPWVNQLYAWLHSTLRALPTPPPELGAADDRR